MSEFEVMIVATASAYVAAKFIEVCLVAYYWGYNKERDERHIEISEDQFKHVVRRDNLDVREFKLDSKQQEADYQDWKKEFEDWKKENGKSRAKKKPIINKQMSKVDTSVKIPEFLLKKSEDKKKPKAKKIKVKDLNGKAFTDIIKTQADLKKKLNEDCN